MSHRDELERILNIIGNLTQKDINSSIKDTDIISEANISSEEVENYLNKLQSRGFIKEDNSASAGGNYRMYRMTSEGLRALVRGFH